MSASSLIVEHLNTIAGKCSKFSKDRLDDGKLTTLEDTLEILQSELEEMPHDELVELSAFCVGICVAVGPTKLLSLINTNTTITNGKDNETIDPQ